LSLDVIKIRKDFPALDQEVYGHPLVYLDNAATSQKPRVVIDALSNYYMTINSNVHRGVHYLSQQATDAFERARSVFQEYIHAKHAREIIITKGATDSINLVANSFGKKYIGKDDEVIISALEHHANIVPWQMICKEKGAHLKVIPLNENLELDLKAFEKMISTRTRIVSIGHVSNAVGIVNPVEEIIKVAHARNIPVLVDGAQGIVHKEVDVQKLDCDFYCFSSHKFYGPMGVGVLYGKEKWLNEMPPYQTGGEMIKSVSFEKTTFGELPFKFETGTPNVADVIGFEAAILYIQKVGFKAIMAHEEALMDYAMKTIGLDEKVEILAADAPRAGVISFNLKDVHPYDAGSIIDRFGIAVRTGNHCAQPVMDLLNLPGTIRVSFALYNTKDEIDRLAQAIRKVQEMFS
jgi:cysteine desulfurase/selenocysteine lyase